MATSRFLQARCYCRAVPSAYFRSAILSDYWALTKPEVNFLILITTFAGFYLGSWSSIGGTFRSG